MDAFGEMSAALRRISAQLRCPKDKIRVKLEEIISALSAERQVKARLQQELKEATLQVEALRQNVERLRGASKEDDGQKEAKEALVSLDLEAIDPKILLEDIDSAFKEQNGVERKVYWKLSDAVDILSSSNADVCVMCGPTSEAAKSKKEWCRLASAF
ncbi:unnamed protein product, partial [Nippostrongylus brasiliensis]|uniref:Kinesin motor domain-containing protein n=1 Tax=Nippostrongylus brasiliensis TaxID=27835 RepID=A0A0N4XJZ2_NIPBR